MSDKTGIPTGGDPLPYRYTPPNLSPAIPLATQRLAANCFVASTGTPFSAISASDLDTLAQYLGQEKAKGNDSPAIGIWNAAVDQAQAVLDGDSISQRIVRTAVFATDMVLNVTPRQGLTKLLKTGHDAEPPLPFDSTLRPPTPGRCR